MIPGVTAWEAAMMGRQGGDQASLFYEFRLEDPIPRDHLLRWINVFVASVLGAGHHRRIPAVVGPEFARVHPVIVG